MIRVRSFCAAYVAAVLILALAFALVVGADNVLWGML